MRTGALKSLKEACVQQAGGDQRKANKLLVEKFKGLIESKEINPADISFKALFEGLVDMTDLDRNNVQEVSEAVASSTFPTITTLITHAVIVEPYEVRAQLLANLYTESDATMTNDEVVPGMTALGGVRRRLETQAYTETDFEEKSVLVRKSDFGRIISLTFEDIFNDRTGMIRERAQTIGEGAIQHQEQMIIETLEVKARTAFAETASRAFVMNGVAYTDSQFYAASHATILDGQVNQNLAAKGVTCVDATALTNAYNLFYQMKDEKGKYIVSTPEIIVAHSSRELELANILATERVIGSGNNDINQFGPRGRVSLNPIFTPFLSSNAVSYMGRPKRSLLWLWVERPNTQVQSGNTDAAFRRRIIWEAKFNYWGGIAHRDYRHIVKIA